MSEVGSYVLLLIQLTDSTWFSNCDSLTDLACTRIWSNDLVGVQPRDQCRALGGCARLCRSTLCIASSMCFFAPL